MQILTYAEPFPAKYRFLAGKSSTCLVHAVFTGEDGIDRALIQYECEADKIAYRIVALKRLNEIHP